MSLYFGIITYDREPYLAHVLRNIYGHARRIVIIEGYVKEFWHLAFTDYTQKVIADVDRDGKVVYEHRGMVEDKYNLSARVLRLFSTMVREDDLIIMMGADEAWSRDTLYWLEKLPAEILWVGVPYHDFYGDFRHVLVKPWALRGEVPKHKECGFRAYDRDGRFLVNEMYHERVYRYRDGWNYTGNHITVKDAEHRYIYAHPHYREQRIYLDLANAWQRWFHYGYVGSKDWLRQKIAYYFRKACHPDPEAVAVNEVRYQYAATGNPFVFNPVDYELREIPAGLVHPAPMGEHPYASMSREEIFNGEGA